jgi:hypothetical protein
MQGEEGTVTSAEVRSRIDRRTGKRMFIHDAAVWSFGGSMLKKERGLGNRYAPTAPRGDLR